MTDAQIRVLALCEIEFYRVSMSQFSFEDALASFGWKRTPDFEKASTLQLQKLGRALRSMLRRSSF